MTHETPLGQQPFEKAVKSEFEVRGIESDDAAAHIQYKLLVIDTVLRANVNFAKRRMVVWYVDPNKTTQRIMETIKPARATLKDRQPIEYDALVKKSYHE